MEETRTPIFSQQLSDLSTLTGKMIKYSDNTSGVSHKCFELTLKLLLTTNRTTNRAGGMSLVGRRWFSPAGTQDHCLATKLTFHRQQHLPLLQAFSLKIFPRQDGLGSRTLSSPGTDPTGGTGGFHGRSQVLIYKMAIFFFHNSMLLHYQILSWGQYLIPEVLDVNERCFASGHWGLNQQARIPVGLCRRIPKAESGLSWGQRQSMELRMEMLRPKACMQSSVVVPNLFLSDILQQPCQMHSSTPSVTPPVVFQKCSFQLVLNRMLIQLIIYTMMVLYNWTAFILLEPFTHYVELFQLFTN